MFDTASSVAQASSFSETHGAMRTDAPPGAQSVPALLRRRGLATRGGALRADGVGFAAEWREAFRLNVGAPEAQALVVSLYAKQLLKVRLMCLC